MSKDRLRYWNKFKNRHVVIQNRLKGDLSADEAGNVLEKLDLIKCVKESGRLYVMENFDQREIDLTYRFPDNDEIISHCIAVNNVLSNFSKNNPL